LMQKWQSNSTFFFSKCMIVLFVNMRIHSFIVLIRHHTM
jgi:hypothetical protein